LIVTRPIVPAAFRKLDAVAVLTGPLLPAPQLPPAQAHTPPPQINLAEHQIRRKQVLDGLISQYQIAA
jgi:hypothetical protein